MNPETFTTYAGYAGMALAGAAACYERFRKRKRDESQELIDVLGKERDAWKSMEETTRKELNQYREETHGRLDEAHARIIVLTEESTRLKAATDMTPVLKHQDEQSQINAKILTSLDLILTHLRSKYGRKGKAKPAKATL